MAANSNVANTASPGSFASLLSGVGNTTTGTGPANLIGQSGTGGFLGSVYGQIPGVANPTSTASAATKGDIGDLTQVANLTQGEDTISAAGAALPFNMNLPGYESNLTQDASNVGQELQGNVPGDPQFNSQLNSAATTTGQELNGQLPQDVVNQLTQQAAERGVAGGQGAGSPNENASLLQALGLNSLQEQQTGLSNLGTVQGDAMAPITAGQSGLSTLIGETPTGTAFNPASQAVTPTDEQAAVQAANTAAAAPDPGTSGLLSSIFSFL